MSPRLPLLALLISVAVSPSVFAADYALLVGVEQYGKSTGLNALQYPEDDVEALATLLISSGYQRGNVVVLTQARSLKDADLSPSLKNIRRELDLILGGLSASDSVVLAFAGHGVKFKNAEPSYFCTVDSWKSGPESVKTHPGDRRTSYYWCPTNILFVDVPG